MKLNVDPRIIAFYQKAYPNTDLTFVKTPELFGVYRDSTRLFTDFPRLYDSSLEGIMPDYLFVRGTPQADPIDLGTQGTQSKGWLGRFRIPQATPGTIEATVTGTRGCSAESMDLFRRAGLPRTLSEIDPAGIKRIS